ncbi:MAG: MraY family glycosyltransferase [Candidatus Moraniibacteriota bacterium]
MEHGPLFYLVSWLGALGLTLFTLSSITRIPFLQVSIFRQEQGRERAMPRYYRLGGVLLAILFLFFIVGDGRLEWNPPLVALCIGSFAIIIFSVADDLTHISWRWHLAFQTLLGVLVSSSGMRLELGEYVGYFDGNLFPLLGLLGVVAWVVLIMNAINWSDGTDGLMPGIASLSFGTMFLLALRLEVNQPAVAILSVTLLGLSLGLLFFNWHPARILSGTGGAYFLGFSLAVLGLYSGMKVATLLVVLAVPVFDALFVFSRRIMTGRSPFLPDKEHLHHLLLARGWRPTGVASVYLGVTGLMGLLALSLEGSEKVIVFFATGMLFAVTSVLLHVSLRSQLKL